MDKFQAQEDSAKVDRQKAKESVERLKDDIFKDIKKEVDNMKCFVNGSMDKSHEHRNDLQIAYNGKLDNIKDVCANYFSRYEKRLKET